MSDALMAFLVFRMEQFVSRHESGGRRSAGWKLGACAFPSLASTYNCHWSSFSCFLLPSISVPYSQFEVPDHRAGCSMVRSKALADNAFCESLSYLHKSWLNAGKSWRGDQIKWTPWAWKVAGGLWTPIGRIKIDAYGSRQFYMFH